MTIKRGGSIEPQFKQLPFCAKCGQKKDTWLHQRFNKKKFLLSEDAREPHKMFKHEFEPCVSLAECEALLASQRKRDERLAAKIRFIKNKATTKLTYDLLDGFEKELRA